MLFSPLPSPSPLPRLMADERNVAMFWDYENCRPASNMPGYDVVNNLRQIAHTFGTLKLLKAYLDLSEQSSTKAMSLRSELQSSGVSLTDCPHNGRKDVADKMILVDMLAYAIDNPAPTTIILISGDRDFAYATSVLRHRRYQVVLIAPPVTHISLKSQASVVLDWTTDVLGKAVVDSSATLDATAKDREPLNARSRVDDDAGSRTSVARSSPSPPPLTLKSTDTPSHSRSISDFSVSESRPAGLGCPVPNGETADRAPRPKTQDHLSDRGAEGPFDVWKARGQGVPLSGGIPLSYGRARPGFIQPTTVACRSNDQSRSYAAHLQPTTLPTSMESRPVLHNPTSFVIQSQPVSNVRQSTAIRNPVCEDLSSSWKPNLDTILSHKLANALPPRPSMASDSEWAKNQLEMDSAHHLPTETTSLPRGFPHAAALFMEASPAHNVPLSVPVILTPSDNSARTFHEPGRLPPLCSASSSNATTLEDCQETIVCDSPCIPSATLPVVESSSQSADTQPTRSAITSPTALTTTAEFTPPPDQSTLSGTPTAHSIQSISQDISRPIALSGLRAKFQPLVERLEKLRQNGHLKPLRSTVAVQLLTHDKLVYKRAGVERFAQYVALAQLAGLVEIGGREAEAWISLAPAWLAHSSASPTPLSNTERPDVAIAQHTQSPSEKTQPTLPSGPPVPPKFQPLIDQLRVLRLAGQVKPLRSVVGQELVMHSKSLYKQAGVGTFSHYVGQAEQAGIIELGGMGGKAWISLR